MVRRGCSRIGLGLQASIKEGDLLPLRTEVADTLAGQDLCTGKGLGAKSRAGIALPPNSAPVSLTTLSQDCFSFLF